MSTKRGNTTRARPQKHQNKIAFRNDLHDTSVKQKMINKIEVTDTCDRCTSILEWKISYKKYKPLTAPKTCTKCSRKTIKLSYRVLCPECAIGLCPKCCKPLIKENEPANDFIKSVDDFDTEMNSKVNALSERRRRGFLRLVKRGKRLNSVPPNDDISTEDFYWTKEELCKKLESLIIEAKNKMTDDFSDLLSDVDDLDDI